MLYILTVPYIQSDQHYNLALNTYKSFPKGVKTIAVINKIRDTKDRNLIEQYNDEILENDQNCLARGWNIGLKHAFQKGAEYVLVANLDIQLRDYSLTNLLAYASENAEAGLWSMSAENQMTAFLTRQHDYTGKGVAIKDGDQSFSCFLISRKTYEDIGEFDEQFTPCYWEDVDYLRRIKAKEIYPRRCLDAPFWHYIQGTIRTGTHQDMLDYPKYLLENKKKFDEKWRY